MARVRPTSDKSRRPSSEAGEKPKKADRASSRPKDLKNESGPYAFGAPTFFRVMGSGSQTYITVGVKTASTTDEDKTENRCLCVLQGAQVKELIKELTRRTKGDDAAA